jgi:ribosomal protein S18 acetylase RimI-like enzyme
MCAKEPFDEHAALSLNLSCYCVVCSFHASIENNKPPSWKELVCPWAAHHSNDDAAVTIRPISTTAEDVHVHDLYGRLYLHLYHEYPAIRKMVKSALKGDLSIDNCRENHLTSTIRDKFIDQSGDFWVATLNSRHDTKEEQRNPIVVGCIGVKRRSNQNIEYEIHRLAVDDSYRRLGVGKELIRVAEGFLRSKGASMSHAVTPSCLVAANKLYESFGYSLDNSKCFMAGALRMNVYLKNICSAQSPSTG